ncbi:MAG: hypothetical protein IPH97_15040 [Ignavibacteriales bacterium]|nr:hypothetical protein [Ignavibacteriales bacterium]
MFSIVGSIHMHSTFQMEREKVPDIAKFADEVSLDFIMLTDHNTFRQHEGFEKWFGKTLHLSKL